jgi:hypothetical protein
MARKKKNPYGDIGATLGGVGGSASTTAGGGGKKGNRGSVGATLSGIGGDAVDLGSGKTQRKAARQETHKAILAVTNYAAGTKTYKPTLEQFRIAWPEITPDVRKTLAPAIIGRAGAEISSEFGVQGSANKQRPLPGFLRSYDPKAFDAINAQLPASQKVAANAANTDRAFGDDLGRAVDFAATVVPLGKVAQLARAARGAKATEVASTVGKGTQAARGGEVVTKAPGLGGRAAAKITAPARGAAAAAKGSKAGRGLSAAASTKGGAAALKTAKITGKVAVSPITHPIKTTALYGGGTAALAAPQAVQEGSINPILDELKNAATGAPTAMTDVLGAVGDKLDNFGIVGAAAADIIELPAAAVPSVYLLGKGLKEYAIDGDSTELDKQLEQLKENSLIGGIVTGDVEQIKRQLREHPIFSLLEASGAAAVAGRGAGIAARATTGGRVGNRERAPLNIGEDQIPYDRGQYSPDLFRQTIQKARDRRRPVDEEGNPIATPRQADRAIKERVDRMRHGDEGVRRNERTGQGRSHIGNAPKREIDAMASRLANIGVFTTVRTFEGGVRDYAKMLDDAYNEFQTKIADPETPASEIKSLELRSEINRENRAKLDQVLEEADPATALESARKNAEERNQELDPELVRVGVLTAEQAERARLTNAATIHLGAQHAKPEPALARARAHKRTKKELKQAKQEKARADRERQTVRAAARESEGRLTRLEAEVNKATTAKARKELQDALTAERRSIEKDLIAAKRKAAHSRGRLERLEAQRGVYLRRFKTPEARERAAHNLDRKQGSLINRERDRLTDAEGEVLVLENALRAHPRTVHHETVAEHAARVRERDRVDRDPASPLNVERERLTSLRGEQLVKEAALAAAKERRAALKKEVKDKPPSKQQIPEQIVDAEGMPLTPERIKEELTALGHDPDVIAFSSLRPHQSERGAFNVRGDRRQTLPKGQLTGKAVRQGLYDFGYESLLTDRTRRRGLVDAIDAYDRFVQTFAPRTNRPILDGKMAKDAEANPEAFGVTPLEGQRMVAVPRHAFTVTGRESRRAEELQTRDLKDYSRNEADASPDIWNDDGSINYDSPGPYVLVPETAALRLQQHFHPTNQFQKAMQVGNQTFKQTVLTLSPKWVAGNAIDINLRAILAGHLPAGLNVRHRKLVDQVHERAMEMDPQAAARSGEILGHGTHLSNVLNQLIHRDRTDFSERNPVVQVGARVADTRTGKFLMGRWKAYTQAVFKANEKFIENPVTKGLVGDALLTELSTWNRLKFKVGIKLTDDIVNDLARGYTDTAKVIKLAKHVEQVTGQWTGNSPMARTILSGYAPFGMWTRAATKYVLWTLPAHHPIKTALLANIAQMTQDEREALGLSIFADSPLPGSARGDIPLPGGAAMPVSRLSSFGYVGDLPTNLAGTVLPQASGIQSALRGEDPFGSPLVNADGSPISDAERYLAAGLNLMGITVPFVGKAQYAADDASLIETLKKQIPFTNVNNRDAGLQQYLQDLSHSQSISVPVAGSSSSSSSSGSTLEPWLGGSSSSSSSGTSLEPWLSK